MIRRADISRREDAEMLAGQAIRHLLTTFTEAAIAASDGRTTQRYLPGNPFSQPVDPALLELLTSAASVLHDGGIRAGTKSPSGTFTRANANPPSSAATPTTPESAPANPSTVDSNSVDIGDRVRTSTGIVGVVTEIDPIVPVKVRILTPNASGWWPRSDVEVIRKGTPTTFGIKVPTELRSGDRVRVKRTDQMATVAATDPSSYQWYHLRFDDGTSTWACPEEIEHVMDLAAEASPEPTEPTDPRTQRIKSRTILAARFSEVGPSAVQHLWLYGENTDFEVTLLWSAVASISLDSSPWRVRVCDQAGTTYTHQGPADACKKLHAELRNALLSNLSAVMPVSRVIDVRGRETVE